MAEEKTKSRTAHDDDAVVAAAFSLLSKLRNSKTLESDLTGRLREARHESARLKSLITGLAAELNKNSASRILAELSELEPHTHEPPEVAKGLAETVHEIVATEPPKNWNYQEISQKLIDAGLKPDNKKLYNAIGYLHRKGDLIRVSRGRYVSRKYGFGIITTDLENE